MDFYSVASNVKGFFESQDSPGFGAALGGDGQAFNEALEEAMGKDGRGRKLLAAALNSKTLGARGNSLAGGFMKGYQAGEAVSGALDMAKAGLPSSFKKQVGLGILSMGRSGASSTSMQAGAALMDCGSSAEALNGLLNSFGAERGFLKLDKNALPALGKVLSDSGISDEKIDEFLGSLAAGSMGVDQLFQNLQKLDLSSEEKSGGLIASEGGLVAMGQFFNSLGASAETVNNLMNGFKPGERLTASALRELLGPNAEGILAPCLEQGDLNSLKSFLSSMGASERDFQSLKTLLTQTEGRLSTTDFLNFIENMGSTTAQSVTSSQLDMVKAVLENITRDQELAKTPVFDETLVKLQALGDQEVDENFMKLSPALQALRGGLSAQALNNASMNGQNGQGKSRDERETKEQYRQAVMAANSETGQAAMAETVETVQGYGGQESLARQISQKMAYSHRRGLHRLKMNLNPENLGKLDIELKVSGDQLVAHIRAENREAFEALAGEMEELKKSLAESGIELANITLALDDSAGGTSEFADLSSLKEKAAKNAASENILAAGAAEVNGAQGAVYRVV